MLKHAIVRVRDDTGEIDDILFSEDIHAALASELAGVGGRVLRKRRLATVVAAAVDAALTRVENRLKQNTTTLV